MHLGHAWCSILCFAAFINTLPTLHTLHYMNPELVKMLVGCEVGRRNSKHACSVLQAVTWKLNAQAFQVRYSDSSNGSHARARTHAHITDFNYWLSDSRYSSTEWNENVFQYLFSVAINCALQSLSWNYSKLLIIKTYWGGMMTRSYG
jgi:hypothetical protein